MLAKHGLVTGSPGPGGGYRLAKQPSEITLHDIVEIFEKPRTDNPCPLGPHWCGNGEPCALHNKFIELFDQNEKFLKSTHFGLFREMPSLKGH
jgi:Rrf2 family protein